MIQLWMFRNSNQRHSALSPHSTGKVKQGLGLSDVAESGYPQLQCSALFVKVLVAVIDTADTRLDVCQDRLGNIRADAQFGQTRGADRD